MKQWMRVRAVRDITYLLDYKEQRRRSGTHGCIKAGTVGTVAYVSGPGDSEMVVDFGERAVYCFPDALIVEK